MTRHKATKTIGATPLFGVAVHAGGFNGRPNFFHENKVRELLDAYFTKQVGRAHTGFALRQSRISPVVKEEDLSLQPATIRANYMRYIKSRSKEKAQAKRDARALDFAAQSSPDAGMQCNSVRAKSSQRGEFPPK